MKYALSASSVFALGLGLLFFISAVNPWRMRPFVLVVIIVSIIAIPLVIWLGLRLKITQAWWIGDAGGCLILVILLATFFPRKTKAAEPGVEEKLEE